MIRGMFVNGHETGYDEQGRYVHHVPVVFVLTNEEYLQVLQRSPTGELLAEVVDANTMLKEAA